MMDIIPEYIDIPETKPVVLCFGHAGSYGNTFREWNESAADCAFIPVKLPREKENFNDIAAAVAEAAAPLLQKRRYCMFGHSMGALFAFETEYILEHDYKLCADHLFVCGRHSPDNEKEEFYNTSMGDERLIMEIKRLGGTYDELLSDSRYTSVILPFIKNDYRIHESYKYCGHKVICPLEADVGTDDISVSISDTDGWRNMTRGCFTRRIFSGGHFFLYDDMSYFSRLYKLCSEIFAD